MVSKNVWIAIAVLAMIAGPIITWGVLTGWTFGAAAIVPTIPVVEYKGEFDDVEWITTAEETFYSDYTGTPVMVEYSDNDKWDGNITLSNFTSSLRDKRAALYFEVDGSNGFESLSVEIKPQSGTIAENMTINSAKIMDYKAHTTVYDLSPEDNEVDTEVGTLSEGKYVLDMYFHAISIVNASVSKIFEGELSATTEGDVDTVTFDIRAASLI